jgi:hypothetical protein
MAPQQMTHERQFACNTPHRNMSSSYARGWRWSLHTAKTQSGDRIIWKRLFMPAVN